MDEFLKLLTAIGVGAVIGAVLTYVSATQQLKLKRRMEATESFLRVCAQAHGYSLADRSKTVGLAEQLAAVHLMAGLAQSFRFLRRPACVALDCMIERYGVGTEEFSQDIATGARNARDLIKGWGVPPKPEEVTARA